MISGNKNIKTLNLLFGGSKNKPFYDGTHWHIEFKDDKN